VYVTTSENIPGCEFPTVPEYVEIVVTTRMFEPVSLAEIAKEMSSPWPLLPVSVSSERMLKSLTAVVVLPCVTVYVATKGVAAYAMKVPVTWTILLWSSALAGASVGMSIASNRIEPIPMTIAARAYGLSWMTRDVLLTNSRVLILISIFSPPVSGLDQEPGYVVIPSICSERLSLSSLVSSLPCFRAFIYSASELEGRTIKAVSYTHLTLPTICSV